MYKELLEYIVKNLVNHPEEVQISETEKDGKLCLKIKVEKQDMGRIIGKEGRIIRSIREIVYAYAMKDHQKIVVELDDSKGE